MIVVPRIASASLVMLLVLLAPPTARADVCAGKDNGWWCDGDNLVVCQNGSVSSSQPCPCGCQSMPPGTPDVCKSCGGFCSGKDNGWWCDGDNLVVCQDGNAASSEQCKCGCQSMPPGTPDVCKSCGGFCSGKANGWWCNGDNLVVCKDGNETSSTPCPDGCLSMPEGTPDKCADPAPPPPTGFCADKADGKWCDGNDLVTCSGGSLSQSAPCPDGCLSMPEGIPDKCADPVEPPPSGFCADKADGSWCNGANLVQCENGSTFTSQPCANGCTPMPGNLPDVCAGEPGTFCQGKTDGDWCNGDLLVHCLANQQVSSIACPNGCQPMPQGVDDICQPGGGNPGDQLLTVTQQGQCGIFSGSVDLWAGTGLPVFNQKDWPDDTLGTCTGLTIKTSGCLISSLSMLYGFLGVPRTVESQSGNSPPLEDAWRSILVSGHTRGYAAAYNDAGTYIGECNAYWNTNPDGVALQYHYNDASGCITYDDAQAIAQSLNSGMPVIAGVHWIAGLTDQHWVLITGADSQGVFFNDPWGGAANVRLASGKLGSYTIDTFFTPYLVGGMGGGDEPTLIDEDGLPVDDERGTSRLPSILDDDGNPQTGFVVTEDGTVEQTGGCGTAGHASSSALALFGFLLAASLVARHGRRGRNVLAKRPPVRLF